MRKNAAALGFDADLHTWRSPTELNTVFRTALGTVSRFYRYFQMIHCSGREGRKRSASLPTEKRSLDSASGEKRATALERTVPCHHLRRNWALAFQRGVPPAFPKALTATEAAAEAGGARESDTVCGDRCDSDHVH